MPLVDKVQERISVQLLTELTNQGLPAATAIDLVKLGTASDDVEAVFLAETGVTYDDLDNLAISVCTDGVLSTLQSWSGITGRNATEIRQRWERGLIRVAQTRGSERRLLASSTSTLEPSVEHPGSLPDQDRQRWAGLVPRMPADADDDDSARRLGV